MRHRKSKASLTALYCVVVGCAGLMASCGPDGSGQQGGSDSVASQASSTGNSTSLSQRQRQAEFLNRIRQSDPQYQTIEKAVLNENNELGLILAHNVQLDSIPALMKAVLTQMSREFPGQDLTVMAYAPTQPPARIGTAHFNARTSQMTYTPEHPNRNL